MTISNHSCILYTSSTGSLPYIGNLDVIEVSQHFDEIKFDELLDIAHIKDFVKEVIWS